MTPDDLDAIVTRAASVYPEDAGWDGDEAERALTTVTQHVPALAAALRGAWRERDGARVASTPNEREAMLRAALDNREACAQDLAALVVHSDRRVAELAAERDALRAEVEHLRGLVERASEQVHAVAEERDAALAAVDAVRAVQRSLSDEQLSAIRADAAEWVVPHDSCFGCLFDADRRDEGITAYVCSECRAPYCEEHRDCDKHDYSNERCGCDGKPVPWEPWSNNVERLAMAEELIAMRALVRGGDRG